MTYAVLLLAWALAIPGVGDGEPPKTVRIRAFPPAVELFGKNDHKRFIVVAEFTDGTTREVTKEITLSFGDNPPVKMDNQFVVHAIHDGAGELRIKFGDHKIVVPVRVEGAKRIPPISFQNEVIPVLTRAGCNAGTCHGNSAGKNGFRLSLFGFNMDSDHTALTREMRGRRSNPADPDASLILTKPLRQVSHKGGKRLQKGGHPHQVLRRWIAEGSKSDVGKAAKLVELEVLPNQVVLNGANKTQRFMVQATYSDGSRRDVTDVALLSTNNAPTAKIAENGVVTSAESGEAFVLARFGGIAEVAQVLVVPDDPDFEFPDVKPSNYIDAAIFDKQRRMRTAPVGVCDDATFLRRVFLDVINLLPTPKEARAFLDSKAANKRARLVEQLLKRPEFPDVQAMQWAEVLRIESRRLERKGMHVYTEYLRDAFRDNVPFDELVRSLLVAKGSNFRDAAANFYLTQRLPNLMAEDVAQNFLGIRIQCTQCHNHPFERWSMDDYYGFSAFFARVGRKRGEHPYEYIVYPRTGGDIRNKRNNQIAPPKFLGGAVPTIPREKDRREVLAQWLTSPKNPWFKTSIANRIWARFFGRGIVEPADDVRVSNPPSHPGLYKTLGDKLVEYGFDVRKLIRDICASRTYQLATAQGKSPAGTFAEAMTRRLTAEQMLDAISQVTGVAERYRNLPTGARATQVEDGNPRNRFLDVFGRPQRTSACTCDRRTDPTLGQALHLINGRTIAARIRNGTSRLQKMVKAKAKPTAILEELYLATYSRRPTDEERARLLGTIPKDPAKAARGFEDILWALLNSKEFLFNH
jgi:Protein of unknown function (DUF1549)/Protein of unknown function (DUF1553)